MAAIEIDSSAPGRPQAVFVTTHWSIVLSAQEGDSPRRSVAMEELCRSYWYPLYAYVRRHGYSVEDAQDLTQEFFARLLARNWVGSANPAKGRFRTFLLTAMNHFLADQWDRLKAQKRGGGQQTLSLDVATAETRFQMEPADPLTPEKNYERRWAQTVLETVFEKLRRAYAAEGKAALFDELKGSLTQARAAVPYQELATRLQVTEGALRAAVHRLRQRYRELLRTEVAHTVAGADEVEEELQYLFRALRG
ncbi:MAG TPA: sigma-70 family RNA polymerase sigma factor [Candidatus Acidoferrales bacterium]|nr:sigma-70 family RNA polymerase sigma factor [Candidatus Acidoferrales bacterium]